MIDISIIIPAYNVEPYISRTLDSVLSQCGSASVEIIIVDDNSGDGTLGVALKYASDFPDIVMVVHHKERCGVGVARSTGKRKARGKYIWFVDGDDVILLGSIALLKKCIERAPDIIAFRYAKFSSEDDLPVVSKKKPESDVAEYNTTIRQDARVAFDRLGGNVWACNALYRNEFIASIDFKSYCNGEDVLFGFEAILKATRIMQIDDMLYGYYTREGSAVRQISERHLKSVMAVARELKSLFNKEPYQTLYDGLIRRKIDGIMLNSIYNVADKLGAPGYSIWISAAKDVYGENFALKLGWQWLIRLVYFYPIAIKKFLLNISVVNRVNNIKNLIRGHILYK